MTAPFIELKRDGVTRWVILVHHWAIKLPRFFYFGSWEPVNGLTGMLGNMCEHRFGNRKTKWKGLAPTLFCAPLGIVLVMRRAKPVPPDIWSLFNAYEFAKEINLLGELIEDKRSSFGIIDGSIVAVDYAG